MKRTSFLSLLGLAAASPALAKVQSSPPVLERSLGGGEVFGYGVLRTSTANPMQFASTLPSTLSPAEMAGMGVTPGYGTVRFVSVANGGEEKVYRYVGGGGWMRCDEIGDSAAAHMAAYE